MGSVEALRHIRALLKVDPESGDLDAIEKNVAMAQVIIDQALPSARTRARPANAASFGKPASPLDKMLDEPRVGLGDERSAWRSKKR